MRIVTAICSNHILIFYKAEYSQTSILKRTKMVKNAGCWNDKYSVATETTHSFMLFQSSDEYRTQKNLLHLEKINNNVFPQHSNRKDVDRYL